MNRWCQAVWKLGLGGAGWGGAKQLPLWDLETLWRGSGRRGGEGGGMGEGGEEGMGGTANACRSAAVDGDSTPPPAAPARRRSSSAPPGSRPAGQCRQSSGSLTRPDSPCSPAGAPWESRAISRTRTSWKKRICGHGGKRRGQIVGLLTRRSSSSKDEERREGAEQGDVGFSGGRERGYSGGGGVPPVPGAQRHKTVSWSNAPTTRAILSAPASGPRFHTAPPPALRSCLPSPRHADRPDFLACFR